MSPIEIVPIQSQQSNQRDKLFNASFFIATQNVTLEGMYPTKKYSSRRAKLFVRLSPSTLNKWEYAHVVNGKCLSIYDPSARVMYICAHITPLNIIQSSILHFQHHLLWYYHHDKVYCTPRTPRRWFIPHAAYNVGCAEEGKGSWGNSEDYTSQIHGDRKNQLGLVFHYYPPQ